MRLAEWYPHFVASTRSRWKVVRVGPGYNQEFGNRFYRSVGMRAAERVDEPLANIERILDPGVEGKSVHAVKSKHSFHFYCI